MMRPRPQDVAGPSPRLPRRSARLRLTVLFGGLFLVSGVILLAVTYLLVDQSTGPASSIIPAQLAGSAAGPSARGQISLPAGAGSPQQISAAQAAAVSRVVGAVLKELLMQSPVALAIVTVAAVALGWVAAGRILRPLAAMTAAARRISASNLNERLGLQGPDDELKALGDTLDDLFARLESSFQAQRHFIANASHELRTPLTRERAMLQVALDDPETTACAWRDIAREVLDSNAEQEDLLEALLTLASSEGGLSECEPVDLAAITSEVHQARRPEAGRLGIRVNSITRPAALDGDPVLIERLAANLIDNAVRHNAPGGTIEVMTGSRDGCGFLSVTNTGAVIQPGEISRLFQPFQRLHPRSAQGHGYGLGLSIVLAIAAAHRAAIEAHALPAGGLAVNITFPRPAPAGTAKPTPIQWEPQVGTPPRRTLSVAVRGEPAVTPTARQARMPPR
jgi:signal transduction histidine kinase